jgi:hypothetical protein
MKKTQCRPGGRVRRNAQEFSRSCDAVDPNIWRGAGLRMWFRNQSYRMLSTSGFMNTSLDC